MSTDLTVRLVNQPGTLERASDALGRAGINIEGACGYVCGAAGVYHVLVEDADRAQRALIDAGLEIEANQPVAVTPVENQPGAAAAVLRRIAEANLNIDLLYMTVDGRLVLSGDDIAGIKRVLG